VVQAEVAAPEIDADQGGEGEEGEERTLAAEQAPRGPGVANVHEVEEALDQPVVKLLSGPLGGDQQIGAMIATGDIDVVFFFFDPMEAQPHDSDVKALLRLAVAWNLPMACDRSTADFLMTSRFMQEEYEYERREATVEQLNEEELNAINVYTKFNTQNKHKMVSIPTFKL
jgi:methylglyoxal synthase